MEPVSAGGQEDRVAPLPDVGDPIRLEDTPPIAGQECYIYSYILYTKPLDGIIGHLKVISAHGDIDAMKERFAKVEGTNRQCFMRWGVTGHWEVLRDPLTDTEGTIDLVKIEGDDDDFMGEKLTRYAPKNDQQESVMDRATIENYKQNVKLRMAEEKRLQLRKQAMGELQAELDNPKSLSSYAQLQWQRLTQKSTIAECQAKLEEAQKALWKNIRELQNRRRRYPHYETKWQDEIRRIHKLMDAKHANENPIDKPVANLGYEDDETLGNFKAPDIEDEFDTGVGVELKGKKQATDESKGKEEQGKEETAEEPPPDLVEQDQALKDRVSTLEQELEEKKKAVAASFMPNAPIKHVGPNTSKQGKRKNKKKASGK